jgi:hypothetical protein
MRSDPTSELLAESSAVALWVDSCGSTPMTIMVNGFPLVVWVGNPRRTIRLQVPLTAACGRTSLQSRRERRPAG